MKINLTKIVQKKFLPESTVAYLKRQEDGRYTINIGSVYESAYDLWLSTEAINDKTARVMFKKVIRFYKYYLASGRKEKVPGANFIDLIDALSWKDLYQLDSEEIKNYW